MSRLPFPLGLAMSIGFLFLVGGCRPQAPAQPASGTTPATTESTSANTASPAVTKVKLLLNWFPEAEHGGFYAAQIHGYYLEAGLEVEIVPGGPNVPVVQQVAGSQVEFGVTNADQIIYGRAQQAPVMALMAPLQISPRCLIVHEKSGINGFGDLHDMTVAMSNTNAYSHFLRKKFPFSNVQIVPYPGNVTQFLRDDKFAQQGYVFSEPIIARKLGGDPRVLLVAAVGFNPYTSCLIAKNDLVKNESEIVRGMVQGSIKGWRKYLESPGETNALIHSLNPEMPLDVLEGGVAELRKLVLDPVAEKEGLGTMSEARWSELISQLVEIEQLEAGKVTATEVFTTEFLSPKP